MQPAHALALVLAQFSETLIRQTKEIFSRMTQMNYALDRDDFTTTLTTRNTRVQSVICLSRALIEGYTIVMYQFQEFVPPEFFCFR